MSILPGRFAAAAPGALHRQFAHTVCPWKGTASYYSVVVGQSSNPDAAWYYPAPKPAADVIRDRVAFWRDVQVTEETTADVAD